MVRFYPSVSFHSCLILINAAKTERFDCCFIFWLFKCLNLLLNHEATEIEKAYESSEKGCDGYRQIEVKK
jgi:hypothetical protein